MWKKRLTSVLAMVAICANVSATSFSGVKGNQSQYSAPFTSLSDNDVSGSAASGWYFKTASVTGGQGIKEAIVSANEKSSYTQTTDGNYFNYVTFTIVVGGKITQSGGGGTTPTYSLKSRRDGELYIDPTEAVIPAGGSITFYGKEKFLNVADPTGSKKCDWTLLSATSTTYKVAGVDYTPNPVFRVESTSCPVSPSSNYKTPDPGTYTIKAKASPSAEITFKNATLKVVGISEVQAKLRTATDYSSVTGTLYAAVGDSLSVKAIVDPLGCSWPSNTPEWSTSGDEWFSDRVSGIGETKTVDTSEIEDGFTITATCGTSTQSIDVAVYECEFTLYVQSPYGGPVGIISILDKEISVGHTFWQFSVSDFALSHLKANELQSYSLVLNKKFGFYPNFDWNNPYRTSGPGEVNNDDAHDYDDSETSSISFTNLNNGLSTTKNLKSSPGTYILGTRIKITDNGVVQHDATNTSDRNCTSVAKEVGSSAGVSTPAAFITNWTTTQGTLTILYSGNNPYTLNSNM